MIELEVNITKEDIKKAKKARARKRNLYVFERGKSCPIAQSLHRMGFQSFWVGSSAIRIYENAGLYETVPFDDTVQAYIKKADNTQDHVEPTKFLLRIKEEMVPKTLKKKI